MEKLTEYFNSIESSFRKLKFLTASVLIFAAVVALGSIVYAAAYVSSHSDNIYILDRGSAYSASLSGGVTAGEREMEVHDQVLRFHELLFNLAPSKEQIDRNIELALSMCDRSGYDYYNDQQEGGYFTRIVSNNISQYIEMDSIVVNVFVYPYEERYYGKRYVLRESNITAYQFESEGRLVEIGRSKSNPHGLMLENFRVTKNDIIGTRKRR